MNRCIKNTLILDAGSAWHQKKVTIFLENDKIVDIQPAKSSESVQLSDDFVYSTAQNNEAPFTILDGENTYLSLGWIDLGTHTGEPGYEDRDTLEDTAKSAKAGGFTGVALMPNTNPTTSTKADVTYILTTTAGLDVDFYPIATLSKKAEGTFFTEIYELNRAGAVAFSDGKNPVQNGGFLLRALQYVKAFDGIVLNTPHDDTLIGGRGQMHEGYHSTLTGMRAAPALAEELMVQRDLYLNEYADSRLHLHTISCARSVELIRAAKAKKQAVSCSVAIANLVFEDSKLADFDTNFKVTPHLRESEDIAALKAGLKDGTIDIICSNHTPQEDDAKKVEFQYAHEGMLALEATFAAANTFTDLTPIELVEKLAVNPRKLLKLPPQKIAVGERVKLTLFDTTTEWIFRESDNQSKSNNSPWIGMKLRGKVRRF